MFYSERYGSVTAIEVSKDGALAHLATGFFVSLEERLYLVTCRHVILEALRATTRDEVAKAIKQTAIFLKVRDNDRQTFRNCRVALFDSTGNRRWRSILRPENVWDVAIIELDQEELSTFAINAWTEEELLPANERLDQGTEIVVLTYPKEYRNDSLPYDVPTTIDLAKHQVFASDKGAMIKEPLYCGASGSAAYRTLENFDSPITQSDTPRAETPIQLVGVFTGAFPRDNPQGGHFHYIDTAAEIRHAGQDCLDDEGLNFRDDELLINMRRR
jgi:hypothetical protein